MTEIFAPRSSEAGFSGEYGGKNTSFYAPVPAFFRREYRFRQQITIFTQTMTIKEHLEPGVVGSSVRQVAKAGR